MHRPGNPQPLPQPISRPLNPQPQPQPISRPLIPQPQPPQPQPISHPDYSGKQVNVVKKGKAFICIGCQSRRNSKMEYYTNILEKLLIWNPAPNKKKAANKNALSECPECKMPIIWK